MLFAVPEESDPRFSAGNADGEPTWQIKGGSWGRRAADRGLTNERRRPARPSKKAGRKGPLEKRTKFFEPPGARGQPQSEAPGTGAC